MPAQSHLAAAVEVRERIMGGGGGTERGDREQLLISEPSDVTWKTVCIATQREIGPVGSVSGIEKSRSNQSDNEV